MEMQNVLMEDLQSQRDYSIASSSLVIATVMIVSCAAAETCIYLDHPDDAHWMCNPFQLQNHSANDCAAVIDVVSYLHRARLVDLGWHLDTMLWVKGVAHQHQTGSFDAMKVD
jgi:hypothetical protein